MKSLLTTLFLAALCSVTAQKTYYIGQHAEGGVIFHLFQDSLGKQHGLVVSLTNLTREAEWGDKEKDIESCESSWDGRANTTAIMFATRDTTKAAGLCDSYVSEGLDDWYLPAIDELKILWDNRFNVNRTLSGASSFGTISGATQIGRDAYWSSTELGSTTAYGLMFYSGMVDSFSGKNQTSYYVRAVRKFSL